MYVKKFTNVQEINFLKSEKFVSFTFQADASTPGVVNGVLPAGTIYPANDSTAKAIVLNDVDVSEGSQPIAGVVEGYIIESRLPVAPTAEAKTALKQIKFM